jgi:methionyl-tRNA formyltransferase
VIAVISQPARPVGRKGILTDPPIAQFSKENGIKCLQPESAGASDFLIELEDLSPDIIITAAYGQILTEDFLKIPSRATINIHPSLLPHYRGATPVPACLLDGLDKTAVSILFTVKKLDAGNIIVQEIFDIKSDETSGDLTGRLFGESGALTLKAIDLLSDTSYTGAVQNGDDVTFCKKIKKQDGLIDWEAAADTIVNRFRAFQPWPGSFTFCNGKRIAITKLGYSSINGMSSGQVNYDKENKSLIVGTGNGSISILKLKPAGGKEVEAGSFWNGMKDKDDVEFNNQQ